MMNFNFTQNWQGRMLGRYRLINQFGHGERGDLWLAEDSQLRRQVTLTILPVMPNADSRWLAAFEQELRADAALDHPHILTVHDFGQQPIDNGQLIAYLVTPFINGGTLLERLNRAARVLQPTQALAFLRQAGQAIDYAHSKNVLHGDIMPANMLLQNDWLYLTNFGIARLLTNATNASRTPTGIAGTPEYIAPEQAQGHAEPASDRYSLAVCAYQLLTGRLPFSGEATNVLQQHIQAMPPRPRQINPAIPLPIEQALLWGLAKRPADRPPTCKSLVDALEGLWLQNGPARIDGEGTYLAPWSKRLAEQVPPTPAPFPPVPPNAVTYATNAPFAPTYISNPPNMPNTPAASGTTYQSNAQNIPTYISNPPQTPGVSALSPSHAGKVSRRALLIGGTGAAVVAATGGTALVYYLHNKTGTTPAHNLAQATPTPAPGPHKLITGVPVLSLTGHSKSVVQVVWDATGRYLATGSDDTRVMLWDLGDTLKKGTTHFQSLATPLRSWKLPGQLIANGLCWSADAHSIAVVVFDKNIYVINAASSENPLTYQDTSQKNNLSSPSYANISWSPKGSLFATNDLNTFKTEVGLWQYGHTSGPVQTLAFSNANSSQAVAAIDFISWSSDGTLLAGHTNFGEVAIWDMTSKHVSQVIKLADRPQFQHIFIENECMSWSPTEQVLAASDFDFTYIWDVKHNKQLLTLQVNEPLLVGDIHPPYVWNMTWSPNGRYLALCYPRSPRIYIWDIQTLRTTSSPTKPVTQSMQFPQKAITNGSTIDIAWSPDGRYIAAGYGDSTAIIWKVDGA